MAFLLNVRIPCDSLQARTLEHVQNVSMTEAHQSQASLGEHEHFWKSEIARSAQCEGARQDTLLRKAAAFSL